MRRIPCDECRARAGSVVCDVPPAVLADLRTAGALMLCRPRQVIFGEGMPSTALYLVCHGAVKVYHADRFGREHILEVAGPGALLGELSLGDDIMSASAEAITEAQVLLLPRERIAGFIERHPESGIRLLAALSRELAVARHQVRELALKSAESRLAGLLLKLAGANCDAVTRGQHVRLTYTRREMAEMIGVSTETAIRLLAALRRKGAIDADRRDIVIIDVERLVHIAQRNDPTAEPRVAAVKQS